MSIRETNENQGWRYVNDGDEESQDFDLDRIARMICHDAVKQGVETRPDLAAYVHALVSRLTLWCARFVQEAAYGDTESKPTLWDAWLESKEGHDRELEHVARMICDDAREGGVKAPADLAAYVSALDSARNLKCEMRDLHQKLQRSYLVKPTRVWEEWIEAKRIVAERKRIAAEAENATKDIASNDSAKGQ